MIIAAGSGAGTAAIPCGCEVTAADNEPPSLVETVREGGLEM